MFQTGAKIYLKEKKILGLWALLLKVPQGLNKYCVSWILGNY